MKPTSIDVRAEAIRSALIAISERNSGVLSAAHVVDAARDPSSPLHDEFEWDDDVAAEAYRLAQAGALVRRVKLHIVRSVDVGKKVQITTTRAFQSRPSQRNRAGGYESIQDILNDEDKRAEMLAQVLRELAAYRKRYDQLVELNDVWRAIDDAHAELPQAGQVMAPQATATA